MDKKKNILVVDDYAEARALLAIFIRRLGYDVSQANDGVEALAQAAAVHPDLILMDLFMPRMDGQEAITRLKADPQTRDIPIILLTAGKPEQAKNALSAGAVDVIFKPIDFSNLNARIDQYI